ncbi:MAG: allantoate amidohydrolase [Hyphomicrobiaceae bacterium]|nr:allantoate amidohydrolase [Hyphomicrobiaceae bacterium]
MAHNETGRDPTPGMRFSPVLMARLEALAAFTEVEGQLTRRYLSPAHVAAVGQVEAWMAEAGMSVHTDPLVSAFGRYEGRTPGAPAIMLGSHIDTIVDAGRYDGNLGVLAAIAVVAELSARGERLEHAIEVAAFGEEEGSRFPAHILTSSALIGAAGPALLDIRDADGITVREALTRAGGNPDAYGDCARRKGEIAAYLELHIEQGPILDTQGLALGAVTAINGSVRTMVSVAGFAGHAGTVPMGQRRDALAAASEMILCVERIGASEAHLVATVGRITALPGAQNVIPGRVAFTIDMRGPSDPVRDHAHAALVTALKEIARRRRVEVTIDAYQRNAATALHPLVIDVVAEAITACGQQPLRLPSGAGHDAGIMAGHCPSGMIFLRCKAGISHNPAESITMEDADLGVRVLLEAARRLDRRLG